MAIKKEFTLKTFGAKLYKWSPIPTSKSITPNKRQYYCNAVAGSQGQDWITTYSYNMVVVDSIQQRLAYVECDYVE
jgi:hypothetical protein